MPVVCVNDVGIEPRYRARFENRFAEKRKSFAVVEMAVKPFPFEVVFVVDKVINDVVHRIFEHAEILSAPAEIDVGRADKAHCLAVFLRDFLIKGDNHAAIVFHRSNRFGQCAHHVAETARLHERTRFGSNI